MKDISYHIMDIVQNSLNAGAKTITVDILQESSGGRLTLRITDDGRGMSGELLRQVTDPFFTTSVTKKVGLGLPLLKQNAELTGGTFSITSEVNKGTTVTAVFNSNHIDMIPMGDMAVTFKMLIAANPDRDFVYNHRYNNHGFCMDTRVVRTELGEVPLNHAEVLDYLSGFIYSNLKELKQNQFSFNKTKYK